MNATLIVIDSDAELARARALVDRLMAQDNPATIARLQAQARLIAAYEEAKLAAAASKHRRCDQIPSWISTALPERT